MNAVDDALQRVLTRARRVALATAGTFVPGLDAAEFDEAIDAETVAELDGLLVTNRTEHR